MMAKVLVGHLVVMVKVKGCGVIYGLQRIINVWVCVLF